MTGPVGLCPTAIVPSDNNPAGPDSGPDRISVVVPIGNPLGTPGEPAWVLNADTTRGFNSIALPSGAVVTSMQTAAGTLVNAPISIGGAVTTTVTSTNGANLTVAAVPAPTMMRRNTPVYLLQCITYQIIPPPDPINLCEGRSPCLVRGVAGGLTGGTPDCTAAGSVCRVIADEIEDIQFAYACDGCVNAINSGIPDEVIDNQGGGANFDQADFITDSTWTVAPMTPETIRLVQVTVVGRQRSSDRGFGEANVTSNQSAIVRASDHFHSDGVFVSGDFAALSPPYMTTRRRVLTRTIDVRNLRR